jgi:N-acetylglucosaminyldiphosphoundecaprenol N-acetyl-beta-D-mannosaminyltransferase
VKTFTENLLGYAVEKRGIAGSVDDIAFWVIKGAQPRWLACLNPHSYAESRKDPLFAQALHDTDFLIPDGVGIVMASRLLKGEITERVTGFDVFTALQSRLNLKKTGSDLKIAF